MNIAVNQIFYLPDLLLSIFIFIVGLFVCLNFSQSLKVSATNCILIYFWHSFFAILFILFDLNDRTDSINWFLDRTFDPGFANKFMYTASYVLDLLMFGYFSQNSLINILGSSSLIIMFYLLNYKNYKNNKFLNKISLLIIFLPGFNFWSSGISKDAICIFGLCLMLLSINEDKIKKNLFFISIIIFSLPRPYLFLFLLFAYMLLLVFSFLTEKKNSLKKILQIFIIILLTATFIKLSLLYINDSSEFLDFWNSMIEYIFMLQFVYSNTPLGIDSDLLFFLRPIYFLFKPFAGDIPNLQGTYFAIEGVLLFLFFLFGIYSAFITKNKKLFKNCNFLFVFFFAISLLIIFSFITSNYGIALRQKWMIIPFWLVIFKKLSKKTL